MAHTITLDNITNEEILTYPLVLLKGSVISPCPENCSLPDEISINSVPQKLTHGNFKCLVDLELGKNLVKTNYCCVEQNFTLTYKPRESELKVQPIYLTFNGHNGRFQAPEHETNDVESACNRITTCCKLLQAVLAEKLNELGFGRKTFTLSPCEEFKSSLECENIIKMEQNELWSTIGREIMSSSIGCDNVKYVGFISCTRYRGECYEKDFSKHEELIGITDAYVALGGGGLAIFGTACLYTWPQSTADVLERFFDDEMVDKSRFLDDSAYRGTRGGCFSTTLGSVLHELCHTFDLGHTDVGIMGRGFDNIQNIFAPNDNRSFQKPSESSPSSGRHDTVISIKIKNVDSKSFIRRPQFSDDVINKTPCLDDTFFTKSSACILAHHKWFNDYPPMDKKYILSYDKTVKLLRSTMGIRVVEIRVDNEETVAINWCFPGKILKYSFQIDEECLQKFQNRRNTLFVEDNCGNILKVALS